MEKFGAKPEAPARPRFRLIRWLVWLGILPAIFYCWDLLMRTQDSARRASCRPRILFEICKSNAALNHDRLFPPLSPTPGMLYYDILKTQPVYPNPSDHFCEYREEIWEDPVFEAHVYAHPLNDWTYVYLGYVLESTDQVQAFARRYREVVSADRDFTEDLQVPAGMGNGGGDVLYRLREVLSPELRDMNLDLSRIPVVIEWPGHHREPGGHVVFLNGTQRYMKYPGEFPMVPEVITTLRALDNFSPAELAGLSHPAARRLP